MMLENSFVQEKEMTEGDKGQKKCVWFKVPGGGSNVAWRLQVILSIGHKPVSKPASFGAFSDELCSF